ncbi:MAG: tetratricopeptide repeat protein [Candidatus Limnocylindrales bacterium]
MRVARPTTVSDRTITRAILLVGLIILIGIPAFALFYWNDRHINDAGSVADQAVAAAEAAVQKSPNDVQARDHLAAAYIAANRTQDGITQFGEALKISATDRAALLGRGIAYLKVSQVDLAQADFQKFIDGNGTGEFAQTDPQLEQAYYELGTIQLQKGDAAGAVTTLEKALAINGGDADALYSVGQALNKTGNPTKAVSALKMAVAYVPTGWCEPYQELSVSYTALKQADGVAWSNGMVAFCQGRLTEAAAALKPLANGSMKTDALLGLGYVAAQQGDNAGAAAYFNQVLAIDPSNQSASIALASIGGKSSPAPSTAASPTPEGSN